MLTIDIEEKGDVIVFNIRGEFYMGNVEKVEKIWEEQVRKNPSIIALNCGGIEFVDSTAIGTLVKFFNHAMKNSIKIIFFDLNSEIRQLFETSRLMKLFTITTGDRFREEYLGGA